MRLAASRTNESSAADRAAAGRRDPASARGATARRATPPPSAACTAPTTPTAVRPLPPPLSLLRSVHSPEHNCLHRYTRHAHLTHQSIFTLPGHTGFTTTLLGRIQPSTDHYTSMDLVPVS